MLRLMACRIALNSTSSSKGLVKNSTAPAFIALTVMGTSPWPVIKMIGMSVLSEAISFCSSRPLSSGRETSSTRQLGASGRGRARNSSADAKVSGCHPTKRISASSDSRTEMSSSTTKTIGLDFGEPDSELLALAEFIYLFLTRGAGNLSLLKCGIDRVTQRRIAEGLEQARHRTLFEHQGANSLVSLSGDEDDWYLLPAILQFLLQLGSSHPRHTYVENYALCLINAIGGEEFLRR